MRNDLWLKNKLETIWQAHFSDVPVKNAVLILFGRNARTRLGSIKLVRGRENGAGGLTNAPYALRPTPYSLDAPHTTHPTPYSLITITGYFKDERVPEHIIEGVIAHELSHYAHGFSSTLPQLTKHPHSGGVVDREMIQRGFGDILFEQKKWLKKEWPKIIGPRPRRVVRRRRRTSGLSLIKYLLSN